MRLKAFPKSITAIEGDFDSLTFFWDCGMADGAGLNRAISSNEITLEAPDGEEFLGFSPSPSSMFAR